MKIMVLGSTGMLGNAVFRLASARSEFEVFGTARSASAVRYFDESLRNRILTGIDVEDFDQLTRVFADLRPNIVVNCVGLIKQLGNAKDPLSAIPLNSMLPHRLARLCLLVGARLVHVSTDCVFSGSRGGYRESDLPDATDVYGRTKLLGEVDYPHAITLRTSIIGHELNSANALIDWFLSQVGHARGFRKAIFSGLPTVELASVILDYVLPKPELHGLYHVSAAPINKFDLLSLVAKVYGKTIDITPDDTVIIDRSLSSDLFRERSGYNPPEWPALVAKMRAFQ